MTIPQITTFAQGKLAESVCDTAITYCNSTVGVAEEDLYANKQQCSDFLTKEIRFGEPYELGACITPSNLNPIYFPSVPKPS